MSEDRSLDDFAPDADGESDDAGPGGSDAAADTPETAAAPEATVPDADPATATSTWHADGAACDRCDERVQRRWRDGEDFVCADCASW